MAYEPGMAFGREVDVLVIGAGGAGLCAAIEAHDAGKQVLVVEKMPAMGGNTAVSAGGFMVPDDFELGYKYLRATYDYSYVDCDEAVLRAFIEGLKGLKPFLESQREGARFFVYGYAGFKHLEGQETIKRWRVKGFEGEPRKAAGDCLFDLLKYGFDKRGIPCLLNTPAVELIARGGEVLGAVIQSEGKRVAVKARLGVVLACGGYEYNREMLQNFTMGCKILGKGNPGNTGDGITMATAVGAKLWHM
ncbi:MAG: FAD-dependent oxidoreductase, partial [Duodenibacillus sp.]|nr:FAD-dependent oxidoreductase [Duodenibacillus sp.]